MLSIPDISNNRTIHSGLSDYPTVMSLRCLFRTHRPMLTSIVRREGHYTALCDDCGLLIERSEAGRWAASVSLVARRDQIVQATKPAFAQLPSDAANHPSLL